MVIDHEIYIYSKSALRISVFWLDPEFFHNFPPSRIVQSPPSFNGKYGHIWPVCFSTPLTHSPKVPIPNRTQNRIKITKANIKGVYSQKFSEDLSLYSQFEYAPERKWIKHYTELNKPKHETGTYRYDMKKWKISP